MSEHQTVLVRVSGPDQPGITAGLMDVLDAADAAVADIEQIVIRGRLSLGLVVTVPEGRDVLKELLLFGWEHKIEIGFELVPSTPSNRGASTVITVLGPVLSPHELAVVTRAIADAGSNIDRIIRLSKYPVMSYEIVVTGGEQDALRTNLMQTAASHPGVDIGIQREGLGRRAKRLVVLDVDSTLVQDEVIELLADEAGALEEVRRITEAAMAGELDFEASLRQRVRSLAGLDQAAIERAWQRLRLTPGARTFIRTLQALGYTTAIVSGGFTVFTDRLRDELGVGHAHANELEMVDGVLTGEVVGPIVDRARKAELLAHIAAAEGVPLEQTVAVGDGANDLDMLNLAGMGVAFNAKPVVAEAADTAIRVPYLDAVLFLLGVRREDVEAAGLTEHVPLADA